MNVEAFVAVCLALFTFVIGTAMYLLNRLSNVQDNYTAVIDRLSASEEKNDNQSKEIQLMKVEIGDQMNRMTRIEMKFTEALAELNITLVRMDETMKNSNQVMGEFKQALKDMQHQIGKIKSAEQVKATE